MEIKKPAWDNFVESMDFESDESNFKYGFKVMTKKYGNAYIDFCKTMWSINEDMTEEEFCKMNGDMPKGFFDKVIKMGV